MLHNQQRQWLLKIARPLLLTPQLKHPEIKWLLHDIYNKYIYEKNRKIKVKYKLNQKEQRTWGFGNHFAHMFHAMCSFYTLRVLLCPYVFCTCFRTFADNYPRSSNLICKNNTRRLLYFFIDISDDVCLLPWSVFLVYRVSLLCVCTPVFARMHWVWETSGWCRYSRFLHIICILHRQSCLASSLPTSAPVATNPPLPGAK